MNYINAVSHIRNNLKSSQPTYHIVRSLNKIQHCKILKSLNDSTYIVLYQVGFIK